MPLVIIGQINTEESSLGLIDSGSNPKTCLDYRRYFYVPFCFIGKY